jgi:hypothetical protein
LFLQGAHDALADTKLLQGSTRRLGTLPTLKLYHDADHSFHVPARSGTTDAKITQIPLPLRKPERVFKAQNGKTAKHSTPQKRMAQQSF